MRDSPAGSLPSLPSTATWSLTLLGICACSLVMNTWRGLVKENSNALQVGRRPPSSSPANPSGLRIVFRRGSAITSNNGSPTPWGNWNPKKASIPWTAAGGAEQKHLPTAVQVLLSRLPHAGGPGPRAEAGEDTFSAAARNASKSAAAACAIP
jgi:hypothetical protein